MTFKKSLRSFLSFIFVFGVLTCDVFAQCDGVYFKTAKRQIFSSPVIFIPELETTPSKFVDVTGDGKIDFIGMGIEEGNNTRKIYISPGDGNGNFGSLIEITLASPIQWFDGVSTVDFNNDGLKDLFLKFATTPATVGIYQNNGGGSFSPMSLTVIQNNEFIENKVDINNDNRVDLLTVITPNAHNYRLGNADGSFGTPVPLAPLNYGFAGDFNADGKADFAQIFGTSPNNTLRMYYNQGGGNFSLTNDLLNLETSNQLVAVRDFNNDGKPDILVRDAYEITVVINLGNNNFSKTDYEMQPQTVGGIFTGDFTGDGFLDVLAYPPSSYALYSNSTKPYSIFTNNGSGGLTRRDYDVAIRGLPVGDVDGDNKSDLITFNDLNFYAANTYAIRLFSETQISYTKNVCKKPGQTKIVDFDGDNITDKALFRPSDGRWRYRKSSDSFAPLVSFNWGLNGDITQPGDYDADGKTDAAVYRPSDGTWYIINSSNGSYTILKFGISEDKPVSADFDGDETTDIAVYRPSDGNWYIYHTGTGQVSITHFGIAEDKPVQEDYDGDGKADLAVFRPSTGVWYYLKSSDGNFAAINWGISTDTPMPGDYDADGKADLTIYRASEGNWYVLRSFNLQSGVVHFGTTGDIPQSADWDGTGIFDLGVYRPNTFDWYSWHTTERETFGATGEIPTSSLIKAQ